MFKLLKFNKHTYKDINLGNMHYIQIVEIVLIYQYDASFNLSVWKLIIENFCSKNDLKRRQCVQYSWI